MAHRLAPAEERLLAPFVARLIAAVPDGTVTAVKVFGSRARGESGVDSDLDVAVEVAADADVKGVQSLAVDLATDLMAEHDAFELGLAPVVLAPGPLWGLRAAIARDGLPIWPAGA